MMQNPLEDMIVQFPISPGGPERRRCPDEGLFYDAGGCCLTLASQGFSSRSSRLRPIFLRGCCSEFMALEIDGTKPFGGYS